MGNAQADARPYAHGGFWIDREVARKWKERLDRAVGRARVK